jgi:hypothetical protein
MKRILLSATFVYVLLCSVVTQAAIVHFDDLTLGTVVSTIADITF